MNTPKPMTREQAEAAAEREFRHAKTTGAAESQDWDFVAGWMKACLALALEGRYIPQPIEDQPGSPKP